MPSLSAATSRRAPTWGGWTVGDLVCATYFALALVRRESPVIGIISSVNFDVGLHQDGQPASQNTVQRID